MNVVLVAIGTRERIAVDDRQVLAVHMHPRNDRLSVLIMRGGGVRLVAQPRGIVRRQLRRAQRERLTWRMDAPLSTGSASGAWRRG